MPSSCNDDRTEAARACAEATNPEVAAAYIHLEHSTLTELVQGRGRYQDYRIPLEKACALANMMDPSSNVGALPAGFH